MGQMFLSSFLPIIPRGCLQSSIFEASYVNFTHNLLPSCLIVFGCAPAIKNENSSIAVEML